MNERIKELVVRAAEDNNPSYNELGIFLGGEELQKFVALIVKECVDKMWIAGTDHHAEVMQEMNEHFGVK
jgi:hypothetical protein